MKALSSFIFETAPLTPFWAAWFAGFCIVGLDGQIYRTKAGDEYLKEISQ